MKKMIIFFLITMASNLALSETVEKIHPIIFVALDRGNQGVEVTIAGVDGGTKEARVYSNLDPGANIGTILIVNGTGTININDLPCDGSIYLIIYDVEKSNGPNLYQNFKTKSIRRSSMPGSSCEQSRGDDW